MWRLKTPNTEPDICDLWHAKSSYFWSTDTLRLQWPFPLQTGRHYFTLAVEYLNPIRIDHVTLWWAADNRCARARESVCPWSCSKPCKRQKFCDIRGRHPSVIDVWNFKTDVSKETLRVGGVIKRLFLKTFVFFHLLRHLATTWKCLFSNWIKFTFVRQQLLKNTYVDITSEWTAWANQNHGKSWSILQEDKKW